MAPLFIHFRHGRSADQASVLRLTPSQQSETDMISLRFSHGGKVRGNMAALLGINSGGRSQVVSETDWDYARGEGCCRWLFGLRPPVQAGQM